MCVRDSSAKVCISNASAGVCVRETFAGACVRDASAGACVHETSVEVCVRDASVVCVCRRWCGTERRTLHTFEGHRTSKNGASPELTLIAPPVLETSA